MQMDMRAKVRRSGEEQAMCSWRDGRAPLKPGAEKKLNGGMAYVGA